MKAELFGVVIMRMVVNGSREKPAAGEGENAASNTAMRGGVRAAGSCYA